MISFDRPPPILSQCLPKICDENVEHISLQVPLTYGFVLVIIKVFDNSYTDTLTYVHGGYKTSLLIYTYIWGFL